jgi:uncharacterized protein
MVAIPVPPNPLRIDTRALGRRPGSLREVHRSVPAPAGLTLQLVGVPQGATVELDVRLEAVGEGVLVTGTATAPLTGECGRCLDPVATDIEATFQELFVYEPGEDPDEDTVPLRGDFIDLEPLLRDALVLALPLTPVCREGCRGLCPGCGARLDDLAPDHTHDDFDPRWARLRALADNLEES